MLFKNGQTVNNPFSKTLNLDGHGFSLSNFLTTSRVESKKKLPKNLSMETLSTCSVKRSKKQFWRRPIAKAQESGSSRKDNSMDINYHTSYRKNTTKAPAKAVNALPNKSKSTTVGVIAPKVREEAFQNAAYRLSPLKQGSIS